jgi:hypothetical protein
MQVVRTKRSEDLNLLLVKLAIMEAQPPQVHERAQLCLLLNRVLHAGVVCAFRGARMDVPQKGHGFF